MFFMRHTIVRENDPPRGVSIAALAKEYPTGAKVPPHAHGSGQLVYASCGVMEVTAGDKVWMIPPHFGLWVPSRMVHQIRMPGPVSLRTLYVRPALISFSDCRVLHIGPFLRELILEIVKTGNLRTRNRLECALRDLLLAQLRRATSIPTGIAFPRDRRALAVAQRIMADPGLRKPLATMCDSAGLSVRTLQRCYRREIGIDFESWRRQLRLMKAIELLAGGLSVKEVAMTVGYRTPNAFVTMFRSTLGATPKAWISTLMLP
jgi:AraC-like DNA-binding protein